MELLLFIDFGNKDFGSKDYFTLVGGIVTNNFELNKTPVESPDFFNDHRFLIEGSGVLKCNIQASGVCSPKLPTGLFQRLIDGLASTTAFRTKMEDEKIALTGDFIISNLNFSQNVGAVKEFSLDLMSTGNLSLVYK